MGRKKKNRTCNTSDRAPVSNLAAVQVKALLLLLLAGSVSALLSCGGGSSPTPSGSNMMLSGNWQFTNFAAPKDSSFTGGLQSGFLLQSSGSIAGQFVYSIAVAGTPPTTCNGSARVTGTVGGQNVTLTAVAASQTFSLSGTLSTDGSTLTGTYDTVATPNCGTAQKGLQWSATLTPTLSGAVQGNFHSTGPANGPVINQDFQVTGSLAQGPNTGANSATVTGTLNFQGYPCLDTASVSGQISGSTVILELIGANGLKVGQIGAPLGTSTTPGPVLFQSSAGGGHIVQGLNGYGVNTATCRGFILPSGEILPGDSGNVCLGLNNSTTCSQALSLTPALITFPAQPLGSPATQQTIKLANASSGETLSGLQLSPTGTNFIPSDFNGVPSFTETDDCSSTPGSTFSLAPQKSCTITISFSPQQSCPWQPSAASGGVSAAPSLCPPFQPVRPVQLNSPPALATTLRVNCSGCTSSSTDTDSTFVVPVAGLGISAIQPSTPELDFGAEDATLNEISQPQTVTFTNRGSSAVQILPGMAVPPCGTAGSQVNLARPATPGTAPGIQVVTGPPNPNPPSLSSGILSYSCDVDVKSLKPNFPIVSDSCSGTLLAPQQQCSVSLYYAPQPNEIAGGLDYFLQLNTLQCTNTTTTDCEIDSGRFPVELKSALAGPLRVAPAAGLNFGTWPSGQTSFPPLTVTLSNDNRVAMPQTITFQSIATKGDFAEFDNCGVSLAPGDSCTMNLTFTPKISGFDQGSVTVSYNNGLVQVISLRGFGQ